MNFETIAVAVIVALAVLWAAAKIYRAINGSDNSADCSSCDGCSGCDKQQKGSDE